MSKETIRIRTTPNGGDKHISMQIEQKFDFIEILSLKPLFNIISLNKA